MRRPPKIGNIGTQETATAFDLSKQRHPRERKLGERLLAVLEEQMEEAEVPLNLRMMLTVARGNILSMPDAKIIEHLEQAQAIIRRVLGD